MRRRILILSAAAAAAALPASAVAGADFAPAGADGTASGDRVAWVHVARCSRAHHAVAFYSRMRRVPGTERMWMRFRVLERLEGGRFEPVDAPGLDRWRRSRPGVLAFGFRQRVRGLVEGADYRARVYYRWLAADGQVIERARRRSGLCRQHGPLPNLRIVGMSVGPAAVAGTSEYVAQVGNTGPAAALDVPVELFVDHAAVDRRAVASLDPGEVSRVMFTGPACEHPDSPVAASVDPDDAIRESSEADNRLEAACSDLTG